MSPGLSSVAEIHVPVSPTPAFFARVRVLAASLRRFGGALAEAPIVVTVSRDVEPFDLDATCPWAPSLGVEWRWVDEAVWARHGIFGTALARFGYDFDAPLVVLLDADTVCAGPLDELQAVPEGALAGLIAHIAPDRFAMPFADGIPRREASRFWGELYLRAGLEPAPLVFEHTGWPFMDADPRRRACPGYFNLGVLAARAGTMRALGAVVLDQLAHVDRFAETGFRCQLALTLALGRAGVEPLDLRPRWNFPNYDAFWERFPDDAADVRVLHYLCDDQVVRARDLADDAGFAAFAERVELSPVNALLRDRIRDALAVDAVHA